jgi:phenylalanyl-tRNA synthetase beta subunit
MSARTDGDGPEQPGFAGAGAIERGEQRADHLNFFGIRGMIEALAEDLHLTRVTYLQVKVPALHPGRADELVVGGQAVGCSAICTLTDKEINEAHKKVQNRLRHVLKAEIRGEEKK